MKKIGNWIKSHKLATILTAVIASVLVVAITVPCVFVSYCTAPEYDGQDRKSEGIVPNQTQLANAVKYDRVVIFGVDGGGDYYKTGIAPQFSRIFANGSITYTGKSQYPSISAENWCSMFTGVPVQKNKMNNKRASSFPYTDADYPTVFKIYKQRHEEASFLSIVDWYPINYGIIENCTGVKKVAAQTVAGSGDGVKVAEAIADYVSERIQKYDDTITFMHFDGVDHAGHSDGYSSQAYGDMIVDIDKSIGKIYDAYVERGWAQTTLFVLVTDHGHTLTGGHGGESETEVNVTCAVAGGLGNIVAGTMGKYVTQDLAAIVLYALGEELPSSFDCAVPTNIFTTLG